MHLSCENPSTLDDSLIEKKCKAGARSLTRILITSQGAIDYQASTIHSSMTSTYQ
jgi:hypothetical protein